MITRRPKLKSMEEDREKAGAHIETIRIQRGNKFLYFPISLCNSFYVIFLRKSRFDFLV